VGREAPLSSFFLQGVVVDQPGAALSLQGDRGGIVAVAAREEDLDTIALCRPIRRREAGNANAEGFSLADVAGGVLAEVTPLVPTKVDASVVVVAVDLDVERNVAVEPARLVEIEYAVEGLPNGPHRRTRLKFRVFLAADLLRLRSATASGSRRRRAGTLHFGAALNARLSVRGVRGRRVNQHQRGAGEERSESARV